MATVTLHQLSKHYPGGEAKALDSLNIDVNDGEFLVLVGPSGCGKSTALKMIGGLEDITSGEVRIGGEVVNDFASRDRDIAMVFQSYALYPHLSVFDNIAFPLQIARIPKDEIRARVQEVAQILQLEAFLTRKPSKLSGGQRQRVAMGRAIIRRPSVFLMDEPLSNLDAKLRVQMRSEIAQIQKQLAVTTIYVTHDQVEAMTMGDRVALMRDGVLQQIDTPDNIYHTPANTFVASFIGSPAMNLFHARIKREGSDLTLDLGGQKLSIPARAIEKYAGIKDFQDEAVIVGVRPEDLEDFALVPHHPVDQCLEAQVALVESLGSDHMAHVLLNAATAIDDGESYDALDQVRFDDKTAAVERSTCVCRFGARSGIKRDAIAKVAVDCDWLHFFDSRTGQALRGGS